MGVSVSQGRAGPQAVLIAGPTASGKSAIALELAERLGGIVINADSMQVYRELRILTARPSPEEEGRVPHLLYGHVSILDPYSVGRWLADAETALAEAREKGLLPIVVGGTGLYFKALTQGLSPMPEIPDGVRAGLRARLAGEGAAALHAELASLDPDSAARIASTDAQRVLRALEVCRATGRAMSQWQHGQRQPPLVDPAHAARAVLWPERGVVRAAIDARFDAMLEAGVVDEVRRVEALDPDPSLPGYRAHGLRPLLAWLRGEITLEEASGRTKAETRQYAKRQFTWFRHQMADWPRLEPEGAVPLLADHVGSAGRGALRRPSSGPASE